MRAKILLWILGALVLAFGALLAVVVMRAGGGAARGAAESFAYQAPEGDDLPVLWEAPVFRLTDQTGTVRTPADLQGTPWVADFFFTTCTTVCPTLTARMVQLQRRIEAPGVRFVSFSVDPDRDTPEVLADYARRWNPDEDRWWLLATQPDTLDAVARGMRVAVAETDDPDNPIMHSSVFLLVDGAGQVRGVYDSNDRHALDRLVADVAALTPTEGAAPTASGAAAGAALYQELGCAACHDQPDLAPPLAGVAGRTVALESGDAVTADDAYLEAALVAPDRQVVKGYLNLMPSYDSVLEPAQIQALVAHLKTLDGAPPPAPKAAELVIDPVCGMKVRVSQATPKATHDGKTWYFCSPYCLEHFLKDPEGVLAAGPRGMPERAGDGGHGHGAPGTTASRPH